MAVNDDRRVWQVDGDAKGTPSLPSLNEALRQLAESIYKLEGRVGAVTLRDDLILPGQITVAGRVNSNNEATPPDVSATDGGTLYFDRASEKFKVSENAGAYGNLLYTHPVPVYGKWECTATAVGAGSWVWDTEINGNSTYFTRITGNTQIKFLVAGVYVVGSVVRVATLGAVGTAVTVTLLQNAIVLSKGVAGANAAGDGTVAVYSVVNAALNDTVEVTNTVGDRLGGAARFSTISVHRITGSS